MTLVFTLALAVPFVAGVVAFVALITVGILKAVRGTKGEPWQPDVPDGHVRLTPGGGLGSQNLH